MFCRGGSGSCGIVLKAVVAVVIYAWITTQRVYSWTHHLLRQLPDFLAS